MSDTDLTSLYPVRVRGELDTGLSRWLWLVKWFLVIPHALVLALLWIAVVFLTLVAGVSIVFTGRYPRGIFDVNVGVMRPDQLSRRLVWVKSWLLAIPHLLVIAVFVGGLYFADARLTGSLAGLLALFAGVVLATGRRYPDSMFGFVMGMWRWTWRVAAYVALMRDEYPPFRPDMGPTGPPAGPQLEAPPAPPMAA